MSESATKTVREKKIEDKVTIKIPRGAKGEDNFMLVTLNGKGYRIQRGVEVEVPSAIAEIVEKALDARDSADDYIDSIRSK